MSETRRRSQRIGRAYRHARSSQDAQPGFVAAMPYYPGALVRIHPTLIALFVFGVGFFIQCNIATNALGLRFLRITDPIVLLGLPLLGLLYVRFLTLGIMVLHIIPMTLIFMLTVMLAHARGDGEFYTTAFTYLYALFFLFFTYLLFKEERLETFCWGLLAGFAAVSVLLFLDRIMQPQLAAVGLSYNFDEAAVRAAVANGEHSPLLLRIEKAGGLWVHGNEAGPALALAAAAAAYLSERFRRVAIFAIFLGVYALTFTQTLNRSGAISMLLIGVMLYSRMFSVRLLLKSYFGLVLIVLALAALLPLGLFDWIEEAFARRFIQDTNSANNASERIITVLAGIQVMMSYPFGIGFTARSMEMQSIVGIGTPHNGFLSTAFASGALYSFTVIGSMIYTILRPRKVSFFVYAAMAVAIGYMFEELNFNPAFMSFVSLVVAYAAIDLEFRLFRGHFFARFLHRSPTGTRPDLPSIVQ